nr:hypothetical protein [Janthinobacterium sp. Marseille]
MTDIKTVLTDRKIKEIALSMSDEMLVEVFPFARAIEAAVLAASAPAQEPVADVIKHAEALCASHNSMHDRWLNGDYSTSVEWQASSRIRSNLRDSIAALKAALQASQSPQDQVKEK